MSSHLRFNDPMDYLIYIVFYQKLYPPGILFLRSFWSLLRFRNSRPRSIAVLLSFPATMSIQANQLSAYPHMTHNPIFTDTPSFDIHSHCPVLPRLLYRLDSHGVNPLVFNKSKLNYSFLCPLLHLLVLIGVTAGVLGVFLRVSLDERAQWNFEQCSQ